MPVGPFLRRFYDATVNVKKAHHKFRITESIREDMLMWVIFLEKFNGLSYIPEDVWWSSASLKLFTDSAGAAGLGCGCSLGKEWTYFQLAESWWEFRSFKGYNILGNGAGATGSFLMGSPLKQLQNFVICR